VTFHAETDSEGRIAFFSVDVKACGESATMRMDFGQWGTAQLPPVPARGAFYNTGTVTA
jgi:hypothetical protein